MTSWLMKSICAYVANCEPLISQPAQQNLIMRSYFSILLIVFLLGLLRAAVFDLLDFWLVELDFLRQVLFVALDSDFVMIDLCIERHISKVMVQVAMARLIGPHVSHHFAECRILGQLIVLNGLLGSGHLLPVLQVTLIDLLKQNSVSMHCFLL